ncbi:hypothetical protein O3P69_017009 [Scylla paramamosain]|uniref:G-protein coupled receptors family 1 profile domain-containing protein n=1 Tax=Scylla paramamosain TaxID=85552 RepID=A0AAW0TTP2_SCYPA
MSLVGEEADLMEVITVLFGKQFKGAGICTVNLGDDIAEYIRGLFIMLYVLPLAVIGFVQVRVSAELGRREGPLTLSVLDRSTSRSSPPDLWTMPQSPPPSSSAILTELPEGQELFSDVHQLPSFLSPSGGCHTPSLVRGRADSLYQLEGSEAEAALERRTQRYLASMVTAFALCLCPLMILRLVKNMVMETYDNSGHFDITFITFVWVAFPANRHHAGALCCLAHESVNQGEDQELPSHMRLAWKTGRKHPELHAHVVLLPPTPLDGRTFLRPRFLPGPPPPALSIWRALFSSPHHPSLRECFAAPP